MIYYAKRRLHADGCAIVTASHNPAAVNGLKWMLGDRPPTPDDVAALERSEAESDRRRRRPRRSPRRGRSTSRSTTWPACKRRSSSRLAAQRHVVLDPDARLLGGEGAALSARHLPPMLFSRRSTTRSTPSLAAARPTARSRDELDELCEAVYRERAHLGIAFDGDGDRIALVDNEGVALERRRGHLGAAALPGRRVARRAVRLRPEVLRPHRRGGPAARRRAAGGAQRPRLPPRPDARERRGCSARR